MAFFAAPTTAIADHQPSYVLPNPRGLPPIVNGVNATGAIIEGDWGLYRPGHGSVVTYYGPHLLIPTSRAGPYFPTTGRRPRYGRDEVEALPNRRLPPPAESYHRSWSTESGSDVVTTYPPAVIYASPVERVQRRKRPGPRPRAKRR